jgi:thioesterase domain-containing protein
MRGASAVAAWHAVLALAIATGCFLAGPSDSARAAPGAEARRTTQNAQVILIKGLAGIFSSGMLDLGEKLRRRGIDARVESHAESDALLDDMVKRYKAGARGPIIIMGHSLGADVAGGLARRLNEHRIPVALLVTFGPLSDPIVTPNVARAVNYYQSASAWRGQMIPAPGFRGSLTNVNLNSAGDINHFNIEKADRLHAEAIAKISAILGRPQAR